MVSRKRSHSYSIDYVIKYLFILLLPVVILDIVISVFAIYSMRSQTIQSLQDTTALYTSQINTAHISINKYLIRMLTENDDLNIVMESDNTLAYVDASQKVVKNSDDFLESFEEAYKIFFYNRKNNRMFRPSGVYETMDKNQLTLLNNALIAHIMGEEDAVFSDSWNVFTLDSEVYFFKTFHSGDNYAGCFINAKDIVHPLRNIIKGNNGFIALTAVDGTVLTNQQLLEQNKISSSKELFTTSDQAHTKGRNLIISGGLTMDVFRPQIVLNKYSAYERIIVIQLAMAGAVLLIAIFLFSSLSYMKRKVLTPIKQFSESLAQIETSAELGNMNLIELEHANLQFKNLMHQIRKLKIDIYEKELEKQQIMMNYLQLQIRPHFFLNCLNTIYSMAQTQLYEEIMKMSVITSEYFRYIFQNTQEFVPLKYELKHVDDYMKIQKLRYGDGFSYNVHVDDAIGEIRVPPILIQTFIENSLKHSIAFDEPITIKLEATLIPKEDTSHPQIQIKISDTGGGFPEDVLTTLNNSHFLAPVDGHRIGITNAIQRVHLLYEEGAASIGFSNLPNGGACVTILLPADKEVSNECTIS